MWVEDFKILKGHSLGSSRSCFSRGSRKGEGCDSVNVIGRPRNLVAVRELTASGDLETVLSPPIVFFCSLSERC
jgi:hypothetical protein